MFFRAWTQQQAKALGLAGWVRNCPDGSVEVFAEGDEAALKALVDRLHRGSPAAEVDTVEAEPAEEQGLDHFEIRH